MNSFWICTFFLFTHTKNMKKLLKESIFILMGTYLISLSINFFLVPNKITVGGVSGISTILYYILNIDIGLSTILLNIPLFIYAIYQKGFRFCIKSIIITTILSIFLNIFKYEKIIINNELDLIISAIYGGAILGIGLSLIFKIDGTSGGSDLLASILKDKLNISMSKLLLIIDSIIVLFLIIVFNDLNIGLYSIIAIFISSKVIDLIFGGVNKIKMLNIISNQSEFIVSDIISKLNRSATILNVIGGYTNKEYKLIKCIVTINEINKVKNIVKDYDDNAIIYIYSIYEASGKGFNKI